MSVLAYYKIPDPLGGGRWPLFMEDGQTVTLDIDGKRVRFDVRDVERIDVPDLPTWVIDVLAGLVGHERVHRADDHCLNGLLELIPPEVTEYIAAARKVEL